MSEPRPTCLEFFAGGGLARLGLSEHFDTVFANDIDPMKCETYRNNFGTTELNEGDVANLTPDQIPTAELAWASFPCQDLSLAGSRGGLEAKRSGTFWNFWNLITALQAKNRAPKTVVIENVTGLLSSNKGHDFSSLIEALTNAGYKSGALTIDAVHFVPQSRPRLFLVAHHQAPPPNLTRQTPSPTFHSPQLQKTVKHLPQNLRQNWHWWHLPSPPPRSTNLEHTLEHTPNPKLWRPLSAAQKLIDQMAPLHKSRVETALQSTSKQVGAVYRRIRIENGEKVQRAEIRYDGIAGCLRTPAGGSSKQLLLITENGQAKLRTLSPREAARLMGCPDTYQVPKTQGHALKIMGDGVCVPAVSWLSRHLLAPLSQTQRLATKTTNEPHPTDQQVLT